MQTKFLDAKNQQDAIDISAEILKAGGIIGMPTETVYGLAGNALSEETVDKIFLAKGRPSDNPLIVHISNMESWKELVGELPETAIALGEKFWPGPLTIILPKSEKVPQRICGTLSTVAVRMPKHKVALELIEKAGFPLAAPSANTSGKPSPTTAKHVMDDLSGKIDAVLDGGECNIGVESTVLSLATEVPVIYRPGAITAQMLTEVLGEVEISQTVFAPLKEGEKVLSPGTKYKHYSPKGQVILVKGSFKSFLSYVNENASEQDSVLCFDGEGENFSIPVVTYGKKNDPSSQAKHIFDALRKLDEMGSEKIFARMPDESGVGLAVFNRLARAAAFNIVETKE